MASAKVVDEEWDALDVAEQLELIFARLRKCERKLRVELLFKLRDLRRHMNMQKIQVVSRQAQKLFQIRSHLFATKSLIRQHKEIGEEFEKLKTEHEASLFDPRHRLRDSEYNMIRSQCQNLTMRSIDLRRRINRLLMKIESLENSLIDVITFHLDDKTLENFDYDALDKEEHKYSQMVPVLSSYALFNSAPYGTNSTKSKKIDKSSHKESDKEATKDRDNNKESVWSATKSSGSVESLPGIMTRADLSTLSIADSFTFFERRMRVAKRSFNNNDNKETSIKEKERQGGWRSSVYTSDKRESAPSATSTRISRDSFTNNERRNDSSIAESAERDASPFPSLSATTNKELAETHHSEGTTAKTNGTTATATTPTTGATTATATTATTTPSTTTTATVAKTKPAKTSPSATKKPAKTSPKTTMNTKKASKTSRKLSNSKEYLQSLGPEQEKEPKTKESALCKQFSLPLDQTAPKMLRRCSDFDISEQIHVSDPNLAKTSFDRSKERFLSEQAEENAENSNEIEMNDENWMSDPLDALETLDASEMLDVSEMVEELLQQEEQVRAKARKHVGQRHHVIHETLCPAFKIDLNSQKSRKKDNSKEESEMKRIQEEILKSFVKPKEIIMEKGGENEVKMEVMSSPQNTCLEAHFSFRAMNDDKGTNKEESVEVKSLEIREESVLKVMLDCLDKQSDLSFGPNDISLQPIKKELMPENVGRQEVSDNFGKEEEVEIDEKVLKNHDFIETFELTQRTARLNTFSLRKNESLITNKEEDEREHEMSSGNIAIDHAITDYEMASRDEIKMISGQEDNNETLFKQHPMEAEQKLEGNEANIVPYAEQLSLISEAKQEETLHKRSYKNENLEKEAKIRENLVRQQNQFEQNLPIKSLLNDENDPILTLYEDNSVLALHNVSDTKEQMVKLEDEKPSRREIKSETKHSNNENVLEEKLLEPNLIGSSIANLEKSQDFEEENEFGREEQNLLNLADDGESKEEEIFGDNRLSRSKGMINLFEKQPITSQTKEEEEYFDEINPNINDKFITKDNFDDEQFKTQIGGNIDKESSLPSRNGGKYVDEKEPKLTEKDTENYSFLNEDLIKLDFPEQKLSLETSKEEQRELESLTEQSISLPQNQILKQLVLDQESDFESDIKMEGEIAKISEIKDVSDSIEFKDFITRDEKKQSDFTEVKSKLVPEQQLIYPKERGFNAEEKKLEVFKNLGESKKVHLETENELKLNFEEVIDCEKEMKDDSHKERETKKDLNPQAPRRRKKRNQSTEPKDDMQPKEQVQSHEPILANETDETHKQGMITVVKGNKRIEPFLDRQEQLMANHEKSLKIEPKRDFEEVISNQLNFREGQVYKKESRLMMEKGKEPKFEEQETDLEQEKKFELLESKNLGKEMQEFPFEILENDPNLTLEEVKKEKSEDLFTLEVSKCDEDESDSFLSPPLPSGEKRKSDYSEPFIDLQEENTSKNSQNLDNFFIIKSRDLEIIETDHEQMQILSQEQESSTTPKREMELDQVGNLDLRREDNLCNNEDKFERELAINLQKAQNIKNIEAEKEHEMEPVLNIGFQENEQSLRNDQFVNEPELENTDNILSKETFDKSFEKDSLNEPQAPRRSKRRSASKERRTKILQEKQIKSEAEPKIESQFKSNFANEAQNNEILDVNFNNDAINDNENDSNNSERNMEEFTNIPYKVEARDQLKMNEINLKEQFDETFFSENSFGIEGNTETLMMSNKKEKENIDAMHQGKNNPDRFSSFHLKQESGEEISLKSNNELLTGFESRLMNLNNEETMDQKFKSDEHFEEKVSKGARELKRFGKNIDEIAMLERKAERSRPFGITVREDEPNFEKIQSMETTMENQAVIRTNNNKLITNSHLVQVNDNEGDSKLDNKISSKEEEIVTEPQIKQEHQYFEEKRIDRRNMGELPSQLEMEMTKSHDPQYSENEEDFPIANALGKSPQVPGRSRAPNLKSGQKGEESTKSNESNIIKEVVHIESDAKEFVADEQGAFVRPKVPRRSRSCRPTVNNIDNITPSSTTVTIDESCTKSSIAETFSMTAGAREQRICCWQENVSASTTSFQSAVVEERLPSLLYKDYKESENKSAIMDGEEIEDKIEIERNQQLILPQFTRVCYSAPDLMRDCTELTLIEKHFSGVETHYYPSETSSSNFAESKRSSVRVEDEIESNNTDANMADIAGNNSMDGNNIVGNSMGNNSMDGESMGDKSTDGNMVGSRLMDVLAKGLRMQTDLAHNLINNHDESNLDKTGVENVVSVSKPISKPNFETPSRRLALSLESSEMSNVEAFRQQRQFSDDNSSDSLKRLSALIRRPKRRHKRRQEVNFDHLFDNVATNLDKEKEKKEDDKKYEMSDKKYDLERQNSLGFEEKCKSYLQHQQQPATFPDLKKDKERRGRDVKRVDDQNVNKDLCKMDSKRNMSKTRTRLRIRSRTTSAHSRQTQEISPESFLSQLQQLLSQADLVDEIDDNLFAGNNEDELADKKKRSPSPWFLGGEEIRIDNQEETSVDNPLMEPKRSPESSLEPLKTQYESLMDPNNEDYDEFDTKTTSTKIIENNFASKEDFGEFESKIPRKTESSLCTSSPSTMAEQFRDSRPLTPINRDLSGNLNTRVVNESDYFNRGGNVNLYYRLKPKEFSEKNLWCSRNQHRIISTKNREEMEQGLDQQQQQLKDAKVRVVVGLMMVLCACATVYLQSSEPP